MTRLSAGIALLCLLAVSQAFAQDPKPLLLAGFEPGAPNPFVGGKVVADHATDGKFSAMLESTTDGYPTLTVTAPAVLAKFKDYILLKADVYNPQDHVVQFGVRIDDAKSTSYGTRYNDDGVAVAPGKSTFEINITNLTRSNARSVTDRQPLDVGSLKLFSFFMHPSKTPYVLYFDNVRLEGSGLPKVEGLRAFDFGPSKSAVYPGFEGVSEQTAWSPQRGFGWIAPAGGKRLNSPDDLGCDFSRGQEFRVALADGAYEINVQMDVNGEWHSPYFWRWRALTLGGKEVLRETQDAKTFFDKVYLRNEASEDLPREDVWAKHVAPVNTIRRFPVEVTDGVLRMSITADNPMGVTPTFLVVYPAAKEKEGRAWMDALDKIRRERFAAKMAVGVPPAPTDVPKPTGLRFVPFVRYTDEDIAVSAIPTPAEIAKDALVQAAQGERVHAQFGLYPTSDRPMKIRVIVSDLKSAEGAVIPASAAKVRWVRNYLKRIGASTEGQILPYILEDAGEVSLLPGVTRGIWVTLDVPATAAAGIYDGGVSFSSEPYSAVLTKKIKLTVFPFKLEPAKSITLSVTGTTAGHWRGTIPELEDEWWRRADIVMKDLADHGMNAVTGGPGAKLRGIKDGKADIDYADMDRWLALAVKHGLTMPGDSYQGLAIEGIPHDQGPDCMKKVEDESQRRFGLSYKDVIRIVYGDVERHAKEKGWPKRAYYLLDEPRSYYGNVQSCLELIKVVTAAAPETWFSGYYSSGDGRDPYFQIMPVSIAHVDETTLKLTKDSGKQLWCYDGDRARHNIGRWAFAMSQKGLKGYLRNGYAYSNCEPYFDFTEDEGSWCCVYPSSKGVNATVGWERTGVGANDFRYLEMVDALSQEARKSEKAIVVSEGCRACRFIEAQTDSVKIEPTSSAKLTGAEYDKFRRDAAELIVSLRKMLGK